MWFRKNEASINGCTWRNIARNKSQVYFGSDLFLPRHSKLPTTQQHTAFLATLGRVVFAFTTRFHTLRIFSRRTSSSSVAFYLHATSTSPAGCALDFFLRCFVDHQLVLACHTLALSKKKLRRLIIGSWLLGAL